MSGVLIELVIALALFSGIFGAYAVGRRLGRVHDDDASHLGVIQGATLGLIGLLVGFCFSGALGRFVDRQDLIVSEANAISTAVLRLDLLPPPQRDAVRGLFQKYIALRINLFETIDAESGREINRKLSELQGDIWKLAIQAAEERPTLANVILPPLNEAFDLLNARNAASHRHMPVLAVMLVLLAVTMGSLLMGYGQSGRRLPLRVAALAVVFLLAGIVWTTIDLDFPQRGVLQVSVEPLVELSESMR